MSLTSKLLSASGGGGVDKLYSDSVFSAYPYTGNGATQTINNGIALGSTSGWSTRYIAALSANVGQDKSIVFDSQGNYYNTGYYNNGTAISSIIQKHSSNGTLLWQRSLTNSVSTNNLSLRGIAVAANGNVGVVGVSNNPSVSNSSQGTVAVYNSNGALQWQKTISASNRETILQGIAFDSASSVYVSGYSFSISAPCLIKFSSVGTFQWQKNSDNPNYYLAYIGFVSIDSSDNIYWALNTFNGAVIEAYVFKYTTAGSLVWVRRYDDGRNNYVGGINVDSTGNVYLIGSTNGVGFLSSVTSAGVFRYTKVFAGIDGPLSISSDLSGNTYLCNSSKFIKLDSTGAILWSIDTTSFNISSVAFNGQSLYVYGNTTGLQTNNFALVILPVDGSVTGGSALVGLSKGVVTVSSTNAYTLTNSSPTLSTTASTLSTPTYVDVATTFTQVTAVQDAVIGKGGLVWIKRRSQGLAVDAYNTGDNVLVNNSNLSVLLSSNRTDGDINYWGFGSGIDFNAAGFSTDSRQPINANSQDYGSWTFAKAPKFFDVVTYTGNGESSRNIPHELNCAVGMVIIKATSQSGDWWTWHRDANGSMGGNPIWLKLNTTDPATYNGAVTPTVAYTSATDTNITTYSGQSAGNPPPTNFSAVQYVAYLFAHDTTADSIVKCGSFTTDGSGNATVDLGWEPQFILYKSTGSTGNWEVYDTSRGWSHTGTGGSQLLKANLSDAEAVATSQNERFYPTTAGFQAGAAQFSNTSYSYIAIRRSNKPPTLGTEVYSGVSAIGGSNYDITFNDLTSVDLIISQKNMSTGASYNGSAWNDRLRGFSNDLTGSSYNSPCLVSSSSEVESVGTGDNYLSGVQRNRAVWGGGWSGYKGIFYGLKRAIGVFDEICYTGGGFVDETFSHSLGVNPEIIITKKRNSTELWWFELNFTSTGFTQGSLNTTDNLTPVSYPYGFLSRPSKDSFSYTQNNSAKHANGGTYVAYLFASKAGISKVFSYTGNGTSQTINCEFTTGSRFVLIKRTDTLGDWMVSDTKRGIIADSDPRFSLNTTAIEVTSDDWLDPDVTGSGFIVNQTGASNANVSGATYIGLSFS
jgi:hypothetical protein